MEKLVHSRLVGGDGVHFVPIGANVGLLECLADDVSSVDVVPEFFAVHEKGRTYQLCRQNWVISCVEGGQMSIELDWANGSFTRKLDFGPKLTEEVLFAVIISKNCGTFKGLIQPFWLSSFRFNCA